jgi:isopentenyl-diphosphate delta-isomerase
MIAPSLQNYVVLVDENDRELGTMEKMEAHLQGRLHRAFSVFIFNYDQELLIHRRALEKYHSGGLWTNTCCSHPMPGETTLEAAHRRLDEEMGMRANLDPLFRFHYRAELDQSLIEHELDHVFVGYSNTQPLINREEVCDYRWVHIEELMEEMNNEPEQFTAWFKIIMNEYASHIAQNPIYESVSKRNV